MLALITNDDGVESPGIRTLAGAAAEAGLDVLVAAPSWDSSGASASLTAVERDGRFLVQEVELEGVGGRCLGIEAAPAFITRAALAGAFGATPDLVLSGVNRGLNCGHAILHSGTVGAASTAFNLGTPALAFSLDVPPDPGAADGGGPRWGTARWVAASVLAWYLAAPTPVLLNVNVPDVEEGQVRGLRPAALASFGAVTANVTEVGKGYVAMQHRAPEARAEPGTDVALVAEGWATFTALQPTCQAGGEAPAGLGEALGRPPAQPMTT